MNIDRFKDDFDTIESIITEDKTELITMISEEMNVQIRKFNYDDKIKKEDDRDFQLIIKLKDDNNIVRGYGFDTYNEVVEKLSEKLGEE